jgi:hypothetical protein
METPRWNSDEEIPSEKQQKTRNKKQSCNTQESSFNLSVFICENKSVCICGKKYYPQIHTNAFHRWTQIALKKQRTRNKEPKTKNKEQQSN